MGINYKAIESNSVGHKTDYTMYSLDFEEFLWAKGYKEEQIDGLYKCMKELKPLTNIQYNVMFDNFRKNTLIGEMSAIVKRFVSKGIKKYL